MLIHAHSVHSKFRYPRDAFRNARPGA